MRQCKCGMNYEAKHGKPGLITECADCGKDRERAMDHAPIRAIIRPTRNPEDFDCTDFMPERNGHVAQPLRAIVNAFSERGR